MTAIPDRKIAYSFHPRTGEYQGEVQAWLSPLDWELGREIYMLPANATYISPDRSSSEKVPVWKAGQWKLISDNRGKIYYDTKTRERYEITQLGDVPVDTWTEKAPQDEEAVWTIDRWEVPFGKLKERKIKNIRMEADAALQQIQSGYSQGEIISWAKQESGARELTQNVLAQTPDAEFVRAMAENRGISVTDLVEKIMKNLTPYAETMAAVLGTQQRREDQVETAETPEELNMI